MNRWFRPLLLAALLVPSAAWADHPFVLPSSTSLSGNGNTVTFDAAASDHVFFFDHRPVQLDSIKVIRPDGTAGTPSNGVQGRFRSVFDVKLDEDGTWKVESVQRMITGTFKLDGEERRVGGRGPRPPADEAAAGAPRAGDQRRGGDRGEGEGQRGQDDRPAGGRGQSPGGEAGFRRQPPVAFEDIPANATDVHLTESMNTVATFVTNGAPTTTVFMPTGQGLEFDPLTHPDSLAQGETAHFRFLLDGKPAAGLKVTVVPGGDRYREDTGEMDFTTDADGVVAITWPAAGMYWLGAEAEDRNPSEKRAEARRMSYAATLEVMTP